MCDRDQQLLAAVERRLRVTLGLADEASEDTLWTPLGTLEDADSLYHARHASSLSRQQGETSDYRSGNRFDRPVIGYLLTGAATAARPGLVEVTGGSSATV